jgi:hypothetical protein
MTQAGSLLYGLASGKAGEVLAQGQVGCLSDGRFWKITGVSYLAPGSLVKLHGKIDLLAAGVLGTGKVETFGPSGEIIDRSTVTFGISVLNRASLDLFDIELTSSRHELNAGDRGEMRMALEFTEPFMTTSRVVLRLSQRELSGQVTGFQQEAVQFVCKFIAEDHTIEGCLVTASLDSTSQNEALLFSFRSTITLPAYQIYQLYLTTQKFDGNEGILLPSAPGYYRASLQILYASGNTQQSSLTLTVSSTTSAWAECNFESLLKESGATNYLLVKVKPSISLLATDELALIFESADAQGNQLIDEALGLGLDNGSPIPIDIFAGPVTSMSCSLLKGNSALGQPVVISCSGMDVLMGPASVAMEFGIKIKNLALNFAVTTRQANSPVRVAIRRADLLIQSKLFEVGVVVYPTETSSTVAGNFAFSTTIKQASPQLSFTLRNQMALAALDLAILELGFSLGRTSTVLATDFNYGPAVALTGRAIYLSKFNLLIGEVNAAVAPLTPASTTINGRFNTGFKFPSYNLVPAQQQIVGYISYRGRLRSERVVFTDGMPTTSAFTPTASSLTMTSSSGSFTAYSSTDYKFQVTLQPGDTTFSLAEVKKIVVDLTALPVQIQFEGAACQPTAASIVQITSCGLDIPSRKAVLYVSAAGLFAGALLEFKTIQHSVLVTGPCTFNVNAFQVIYYTWPGTIEPGVPDQVAVSANIPSSTITYPVTVGSLLPELKMD